MSQVGLLWRTVRHLRPRQVLYQMIHRLRGRARLRLPKIAPISHFLAASEADKPISWLGGTFTFLNQSVNFPQRIDWNCACKGKLWTYNLNYFDFLNQPGLTRDEGLMLIQDFVARTSTLKDGLEPYPTSLRIINWVHFLSRHQIQDDSINHHLFAQVDLLGRRLEYHLAGNHLLENGFALLMGGLYFRQERWLQKAVRLVHAELETQVLNDGGHDERSPMYHQILLDRLLDVILALKQNTWYNEPDFVAFLTARATRMLGWLRAMTFTDGDVPMVNDAANGIAPTTQQLQQKAQGMGLTSTVISLEESSYRMFRQARYELLADVGPVGPNHQPGHAHADTFSFVLYVNSQPIIVDSGTSTYEIGSRRSWERSTAAHNTVTWKATSGHEMNSSEVWGGFRVGHRAKVALLQDTETSLSAQHDGYKHFGMTHQRTWSIEPTRLIISDNFTGNANGAGIASLHFHPDVPITLANEIVLAGPIRIAFESRSLFGANLTDYKMADGFNQLRPSLCLVVSFADYLKTTVTFLE